MKKKEFTVEFNIASVKAAVTNSSKVQDVALEIPQVDPKDLSIDDQIFGIEMKNINDNKPSTPESGKYVAIKPILIDTLSGRPKPGFITVNGTIDIPKDAGRVVKLENAFFVNQNEALAVCEVITEIELERALEIMAEKQKEVDFLQEQLNAKRF